MVAAIWADHPEGGIMRICVINTGGTIACTGSPLAPMSSNCFADTARDLLGPSLAAADLHFDTGLRFGDTGSGTLDSTDLRPSDWCRMAGRVLDLYDQFDGFVILHGTDTMDYTGAALSFLLNVTDARGRARATLSKPVVLTGSQLPLFTETPDGLVLNTASDGLLNLTGALAMTRLRLPEAAIFFGGQLLRGNRALKSSTTGFAAFDSPHLPALAHAGIGIRHGAARPLAGPGSPQQALDHPAAMALARAQLDAVAQVIDAQSVAQIPAVPVASPSMAQLIDAATANGATGLVVQGFGEGNIPATTDTKAALKRAQDRGAITVIASRVTDGQVGAFHYAAGAWVVETGAIGGGDITPVAALAKLTVLQAAADHHGWDVATVQGLMQRSLVGECAAPDCSTGPLLAGQILSVMDVTLSNDADDGPVLRQGNDILWRAGGAGRLQMRGDRLVLIAPNGGVTWASAPASPQSVLTVAPNPPRLMLVDPVDQVADITIYRHHG
jgi:L-asparaginase